MQWREVLDEQRGISKWTAGGYEITARCGRKTHSESGWIVNLPGGDPNKSIHGKTLRDAMAAAELHSARSVSIKKDKRLEDMLKEQFIKDGLLDPNETKWTEEFDHDECAPVFLWQSYKITCKPLHGKAWAVKGPHGYVSQAKTLEEAKAICHQMDDGSKERAEFEAWYRKNHNDPNFYRLRDPSSGLIIYGSYDVRNAWNAWSAAKASFGDAMAERKFEIVNPGLGYS